MTVHETHGYGPVFAELIDAGAPMPLGPGQPDTDVQPTLKRMDVDKAFAHATVRDAAMARACLAGVWLLHGFLEESHRISQGIDTPTGSYWHAIMHRREPDYPNSKYWFSRTGEHAIFADLCADAAELAGSHQCPAEATFLREQTQWDPRAFVDLVEAVEYGQSSARSLCVAVQDREWRLLFDHSYRHAVGA